jgi:2-polyprenyl-3-methyl-5-hydroxy-6-metoxy-1,4-benzoquinol methylase
MNAGLVLDIGCGSGDNAIFIGQNGFSVVAVDSSQQAIKIACLDFRIRID